MRKKILLLSVTAVVVIGTILYLNNPRQQLTEPNQTKNSDSAVVSQNLKTYSNTQNGLEFKYNPEWSISENGSMYDPSQPFILLWSGTTSDEPCRDLGCPPKSGDREVLTKGDTLQGGPPLNPWYKILLVRGNKWVSVHVTDIHKNCGSQSICQQYLSELPLERKQKVDDPNSQVYNDFIDLISTLKFVN